MIVEIKMGGEAYEKIKKAHDWLKESGERVMSDLECSRKKVLDNEVINDPLVAVYGQSKESELSLDRIREKYYGVRNVMQELYRIKFILDSVEAFLVVSLDKSDEQQVVLNLLECYRMAVDEVQC